MTQKILKTNQYFQSSDLALSATLCCYGYQIEAIDKQNPQKVIFLIKKDDKLDDLIKGYWSHSLKIEPLAFFSFLKELKGRIYAKTIIYD